MIITIIPIGTCKSHTVLLKLKIFGHLLKLKFNLFSIVNIFVSSLYNQLSSILISSEESGSLPNSEGFVATAIVVISETDMAAAIEIRKIQSLLLTSSSNEQINFLSKTQEL